MRQNSFHVDRVIRKVSRSKPMTEKHTLSMIKSVISLVLPKIFRDETSFHVRLHLTGDYLLFILLNRLRYHLIFHY